MGGRAGTRRLGFSLWAQGKPLWRPADHLGGGEWLRCGWGWCLRHSGTLPWDASCPQLFGIQPSHPKDEAQSSMECVQETCQPGENFFSGLPPVVERGALPLTACGQVTDTCEPPVSLSYLVREVGTMLDLLSPGWG